MNYKEKISSDPGIMIGKPVIKGTRITVELVIKKLSEGARIEDIMEAYPGIEKDDVLACLAYSAHVLSGEEIIAS